MNDEGRAARRRDSVDKPGKIGLGILVIDADAAFDRDRNIHRPPHGRHAASHQVGRRHQTGTKTSALHPVGRATAVEIDFVIAKPRPDLGRFGKRIRVRPTQLQCHGMLGRIEPKQPLPVATQNGASGDHLGIQPRACREQPVEHPAMPVRPFHHRCYAELIRLILHNFSGISKENKREHAHAS